MYITMYFCLSSALIESQTCLVGNQKECAENETVAVATQYSVDVANQWARSIENMHWLHDGHHSTVMSQLEAVHRRSNVPPSQMKVVDIACGEGIYARKLSDRFGYERIVAVDKSRAQIDTAMNRTASSRYPDIDYHQMDVPIDTLSAADIEALGGPFDIALANWLFSYADSKPDLLRMMEWTNRLMKPGGTLIAWTVAVEDLRDADEGVVKNSKFRIEQRFEGENGKKEEGRVWQGENEMEYVCSIYSFNTYETLFEIAGFRDVHFLEHHEYVAGNELSNCTREERAMFDELITWKGCILKVFTATKL